MPKYNTFFEFLENCFYSYVYDVFKQAKKLKKPLAIICKIWYLDKLR